MLATLKMKRADGSRGSGEPRFLWLGLGHRLGDQYRFLGCLFAGAKVGAASRGGAGDAVDRGARNERAVKLERTRGVVVARYREVDEVRIRVGVDDGDHRDAEPPGFLDGIGFLVRIDH